MYAPHKLAHSQNKMISKGRTTVDTHRCRHKLCKQRQKWSVSSLTVARVLTGSPQCWELTLAVANSQQMSERRFAVQVIKRSSQTDRAEGAKSGSYDTNVCETTEARTSPLKLTLMFSFSTTAVFLFPCE